MNKDANERGDDWSAATWDGHRRAQLRRWRSLSLRQRLEALDEMTELAEHFASLRREGRLRQVNEPGKETERKD